MLSTYDVNQIMCQLSLLNIIETASVDRGM